MCDHATHRKGFLDVRLDCRFATAYAIAIGKPDDIGPSTRACNGMVTQGGVGSGLCECYHAAATTTAAAAAAMWNLSTRKERRTCLC